MNYTYNTSKETLNTFISFESWNDRVSIHTGRNSREYNSVLHNNSDGELVFEFKGQEIPFVSFQRKTMADIREDLKTGKHIFDSDVMTAIICDGIDNVRFSMDMPVPETLIPMMGIAVYGSKTKRSTCKIREKSHDHPHTNYKIELRVVDEEDPDHFIGSRRFYTTDFASMIKSGRIEILDSLDDGKTTEQHIREYYHSITESKHFNFKVPACC